MASVSEQAGAVRQVVLVTGASSGFGRDLVERTARRGHRVFAGVRDVGGRGAAAAAELAELAAAQVLPLSVVELDVTDDASVERAVAHVVGAAGRLDAVVNNAGQAFAGPLEAFTAEEAQRQFDVNVVGVLRVSRAALPHLRAQGHGLLLQVGSVGGRISLPYAGLYGASKFALEGLSEALAHEVAPFGVEVAVVEPGSYPTRLGANGTLASDRARSAPYAEGFTRWVSAFSGMAASGVADPGEVAAALLALVELPAGTRPLRTVVAAGDQGEGVREANDASARAAARFARSVGVESFLSSAVTGEVTGAVAAAEVGR